MVECCTRDVTTSLVSLLRRLLWGGAPPPMSDYASLDLVVVVAARFGALSEGSTSGWNRSRTWTPCATTGLGNRFWRRRDLRVWPPPSRLQRLPRPPLPTAAPRPYETVAVAEGATAASRAAGHLAHHRWGHVRRWLKILLEPPPGRQTPVRRLQRPPAPLVRHHGRGSTLPFAGSIGSCRPWTRTRGPMTRCGCAPSGGSA